MARSLNKVMLIGNVGSDPEIRAVGSGARVANFSLATSRRWNDRNGQQQEKTEWHRIVVWENTGGSGGPGIFGVIEKYVKKGERIFVEGEIEYREYDDKDGNRRYVTEIRGRELMLLGGKEGGGGGGDYDRGGSYDRGSRQSSGASSGSAPRKPAGGSEYDDFNAGGLNDDDDLPF